MPANISPYEFWPQTAAVEQSALNQQLQEIENQLTSRQDALARHIRIIVENIRRLQKKRQLNDDVSTQIIEAVNGVLDNPDVVKTYQDLITCADSISNSRLKHDLKVLAIAVLFAALITFTVMFPAFTPITCLIIYANFHAIPALSVGFLVLNIAYGLVSHSAQKAAINYANEVKYKDAHDSLLKTIADTSPDENLLLRAKTFANSIDSIKSISSNSSTLFGSDKTIHVLTKGLNQLNAILRVNTGDAQIDLLELLKQECLIDRKNLFDVGWNKHRIIFTAAIFAIVGFLGSSMISAASSIRFAVGFIIGVTTAVNTDTASDRVNESAKDVSSFLADAVKKFNSPQT